MINKVPIFHRSSAEQRKQRVPIIVQVDGQENTVRMCEGRGLYPHLMMRSARCTTNSNGRWWTWRYDCDCKGCEASRQEWRANLSG